MRKTVLAMTGVFVFAAAAQVGAQAPLKGSRTAMRKQNSVAHAQDYTFLRTSRDVRRFIEAGLLVPVRATSSMKLAGVSYPYARPAVKTFAERLAGQYENACGNKLVVTSLTRPLSQQPWNASDLSVHPAGMAIDIRVSDRRACRSWLENTLVSLEKRGVLEATREHNPAHYHVAIFPTAYLHYVDRLTPRIAHAAEPRFASVLPLPARSSKSATHKVRTGESLWSIAKQNGVTVAALQRANDLRGSRIMPGQVLAIPQQRSSEAD